MRQFSDELTVQPTPLMAVATLDLRPTAPQRRGWCGRTRTSQCPPSSGGPNPPGGAGPPGWRRKNTPTARNPPARDTSAQATTTGGAFLRMPRSVGRGHAISSCLSHFLHIVFASLEIFHCQTILATFPESDPVKSITSFLGQEGGMRDCCSSASVYITVIAHM